MADPKRPGRPSLDPSGAPSAAVSVKLQGADYDRVYQLAKQQRTSISDVIRQGVQRFLKDDRGGTF